MKKVIFLLVFSILMLSLLSACQGQNDKPETALHETTEDSTENEALHDTKDLSPFKIIEEMMDELERKGWGDFEIVEGEVDSRQRWSVVLETTTIDESMSLYTILGQIDGMYENPITVVVKMIFSDETPGGKHEILYVSKAGRYMSADISDLDEILEANDNGLWEFMYSY